MSRFLASAVQLYSSQPIPDSILGVCVRLKMPFLIFVEWWNALQRFDVMLKREAPVDTYILNIIIDCFCPLEKLDFSILGSILKRGPELCVVTIDTLLKCLFSKGRMEEADQLLKDMVAHQMTCNICVDAFYKHGNVELAEDNLTNVYYRRGQVDEVLRHFVEIATQGLEHYVVSYSTTMLKVLFACERAYDARSLLDRSSFSRGLDATSF